MILKTKIMTARVGQTGLPLTCEDLERIIRNTELPLEIFIKPPGSMQLRPGFVVELHREEFDLIGTIEVEDA